MTGGKNHRLTMGGSMTSRNEQLIADAEAKAAAFEVDPEKGLAAGYRPVQEWGWTPTEMGQPREHVRIRSEYAAWLFGVAQKDLPDGSWRLQTAMGSGPQSAFLVTLQGDN